MRGGAPGGWTSNGNEAFSEERADGAINLTASTGAAGIACTVTEGLSRLCIPLWQSARQRFAFLCAGDASWQGGTSPPATAFAGDRSSHSQPVAASAPWANRRRDSSKAEVRRMVEREILP